MYKVCKLKLAMESNCSGNGNGGFFVSSSSSRDIDQKVETVDDLLEECWFFENLLKRRTTMMLRCNSDPCPSSSSSSSSSSTLSQDLLPKTSDSEIENTSTTEKKGNGVVHHGLVRTPSLPPGIGRKEEKKEKESNSGIKKLTRQSSHQNMLQAPKPSCKEKKGASYNKKESESRSKLSGQSSHRRLLRTPSLPPNIGREDISQDEDSDARMSRLIQRAFASSSESLNPQHNPKDIIQSCSSIPMARPPRSSEVESNNTNGIKEMSLRYLNQQKMIKKSVNDLETEEVQGFKNLGSTFEKKDLRASVIYILPGLQEKKREKLNQDNNKMRRPYLSEAWLVQSCAPPVPNWVRKNSAVDMKAQLKFWARAVASNVRQEY